MIEKTGGADQGFYFKVGSDFFGMYHSSEGPKLFFNRDKYNLSDNCWDVELVIGPENTLFTFYWQGEVKISFRCAKQHESILALFQLLQEKPHRQLV
ncbi:hypothetical protein [Paenibacillus koleovorans]|uniref:hypothetical protein n=1 Tax=Paenibacillus koleovorans TaxID=121608 RepID=UPI001FE8C831|nr:hypothetical protein [Paenibacillus koleovorans]